MFRSMHWATPEERRALGQARRKQVGRHQHDALDLKARQASALAIVERSMRGRVPALIGLKYQLIAESPFAFFRGAAPVMAADLAQLPSTGIVSQLCGDAHVRNLGAYSAPDGRLVFDINDFDETIRGPFEWDLKRMAASLVLAGRAAGHKDGSARNAAAACIERYAAQMRAFTCMTQLEVNRFQVHRIDLARPVHAALTKAERATPQHTLEQLTNPAQLSRHTLPPATRCRAVSKNPHPCLRALPALAPPLCWLRSDPTAKCWSCSASICSRFTSPSMWLSKWWAPAPLACATTASTWKATAPPIRSFCRSRRRLRQLTRPGCLTPPLRRTMDSE